MRNRVEVRQPTTPPIPTIGDLETGEMFYYLNAISEHVYIKAKHTLGPCVVSLLTGEIYSNPNWEATVQRVTEIVVRRP